eukprot:TRINITY_DN11177_c1_g2_i1.p1 TRINITY_DN11177_c1_g2~~TRINITY_DN11177_c1_g2_i1.p1  ORF type:complete len:483 (+),score=168.85 TRINITY_DN11177_c1_g2_i1:78-1526(+)
MQCAAGADAAGSCCAAARADMHCGSAAWPQCAASKALAKEELLRREALCDQCGSELTVLLANALWEEAAARAAGEAALRSQLAAARDAAAAAAERQVLSELEAQREREAAREEARSAKAAQHAAQRRHAACSQRVEQLELVSAQLRSNLQCLAEEHAAALGNAERQREELDAATALQRVTQGQCETLADQHSAAQQLCEDLQRSMQELQERNAEQEARAAEDRALTQQLREELQRAEAQCSEYERERARRGEWQCLSAAEEAGRESLGSELTGTMQLLGSEHSGRGKVIMTEGYLRRLLCHKYKHTGPGSQVSNDMPASKALKVDNVCFGVAVFVPKDWAPVCSTAAHASFAVMRGYSLGWKAGEDMLGPFRSRGRHSSFDETHFGPEPGLLFNAKLAVDALLEEAMRGTVSADWATAWSHRWYVHYEIQVHLYEEMRLRYKEVWLTCVNLAKKAAGAADRLREVLIAYGERAEAEGAAHEQ